MGQDTAVSRVGVKSLTLKSGNNEVHKDSCKRRKVQGGIEHFPASFPIDRSLCPQLFFCGQSGGESIDFFNYCDYGIVGDMDEVCDAMIAQLKAR